MGSNELWYIFHFVVVVVGGVERKFYAENGWAEMLKLFKTPYKIQIKTTHLAVHPLAMMTSMEEDAVGRGKAEEKRGCCHF